MLAGVIRVVFYGESRTQVVLCHLKESQRFLSWFLDGGSFVFAHGAANWKWREPKGDIFLWVDRDRGKSV